MNSRLQNQLTMAGSCITLANSADHKPVWFGNDPADFGTDLVQLATDYGTITAKAALADAAAGGAADAKAVSETTLEDAAHVLARALAVHFKKTGNLTAKAALAEAAAGGAADAKAVAETSLEDAAYILARALAVHFKKTGNLTARA